MLLQHTAHFVGAVQFAVVGFDESNVWWHSQ
jgi:hypothetical protein